MSKRSAPAPVLALCLGLLAFLAPACKHEQPTPTGPAPVDSAAENARQQHFDSELGRAYKSWQEPANLGKCADILPEKSDTELCRAASSALLALAALPAAAPPDQALPALGAASLALAKLRERARYLSFEDIRRRRLSGDGGLSAPTADSAHPAAAPSARAPSSKPEASQHASPGRLGEQPSLKLADGALSLLAQDTVRLEQGALRNLAAYLEYGALPVRRQAFDLVKGLHAQHPRWPALGHVLREAEVLETDGALKHDLNELLRLPPPRAPAPDQPTDSK